MWQRTVGLGGVRYPLSLLQQYQRLPAGHHGKRDIREIRRRRQRLLRRRGKPRC